MKIKKCLGMVEKYIKFYRSVDIAISRGFFTQYAKFTNYKQESKLDIITNKKS